MTAEEGNHEFNDTDTDEENQDPSLVKKATNKKKVEGLVSLDYFVSKDAMERLISKFIQENPNSDELFRINNKSNGRNGFITYKEFTDAELAKIDRKAE